MVTKEVMIKGLDALEALIKEQEQMRRDALIYIHEKGEWDPFMKFHAKQHIKRSCHE